MNTALLYPCCRGRGCRICEGVRPEPHGTYLIVKDLPGGLHVGLSRMLFNWRVVRGDGTGYDRGWCYFGTGYAAFTMALKAAQAWDGEDATEPDGWDKRIAGPRGTRQAIKKREGT